MLEDATGSGVTTVTVHVGTIPQSEGVKLPGVG